MAALTSGFPLHLDKVSAQPVAAHSNNLFMFAMKDGTHAIMDALAR